MEKNQEVFLLKELLELQQFLEEYKTKPKEVYNKRSAILFLKSTIEDLTKKSYSFDEISQLLREKNFYISASVLGKFIKDEKQTGEKKPKRQKKTKRKIEGGGPEMEQALGVQEKSIEYGGESDMSENLTEEIEKEDAATKSFPKVTTAANFVIKEDSVL